MNKISLKNLSTEGIKKKECLTKNSERKFNRTMELENHLKNSEFIRKLLIICIVTVSSLGLLAQTGNVFGQNPKREVLFTLGANEKIYVNEYYLYQTVNQNRFACIAYDTLKGNFTFVFNGKRVPTSGYISVPYLNVNDENGYVIHSYENGNQSINFRGTVYKNVMHSTTDENYENIRVMTREGDNQFIHYKGIKDGPFEEIALDDYYDYRYLLAGRWWGHKNGKNELIQKDNENKKTVFKKYEDGKYYVYINGVKSPAYDVVNDLRLTESGKYAYWFTNNGKYYININGTSSPAYDGVNDLQLTESGKYTYWFNNNDKWYAHINGTSSPAYDGVNYLKLTESGKYAYSYRNNGKSYVNINGTSSPAYDNIGYTLRLTESGKYAYIYKNDGKEYVNINGTSSPAYDNVDYYYDVKLTESGKYAYFYNNNDKWYVNINGTSSPAYDGVNDLQLTESGKYAYSFNNNDKWYVNINGTVSPAYDKVNYVSLSDNGGFQYEYYLQGRNYFKSNTKEEIVPLGASSWYMNVENFIEFYSDNKEHLFLSGYAFPYITIDGKPYGKSAALSAWYDETKNAFIWNAIEGKELVVYEFKLNN